MEGRNDRREKQSGDRTMVAVIHGRFVRRERILAKSEGRDTVSRRGRGCGAAVAAVALVPVA